MNERWKRECRAGFSLEVCACSAISAHPNSAASDEQAESTLASVQRTPADTHTHTHTHTHTIGEVSSTNQHCYEVKPYVMQQITGFR